MEQHQRALICFTRVPRPGQTKTRLLPLLSPADCAGLHWAFLRDLDPVYGAVDAALFVAHTPDPQWESLRLLFPGARGFFPQEGEDLGQRMHRALCQVLDLGYEAVVLTGSDLPLLRPRHLEAAFHGLENHDLALGPTEDGGYYLLGCKAPCPALFDGQSYGHGSVYQNALAAAAAAGLTVFEAPGCADVDSPEDLRALGPRLGPDSASARYLQQLKKEGITL